MQIVVLAGGVGGSRFTAGVRQAYPDATVTIIGNTADDITIHGMRVCPDLDTLMYTLGGGGDAVRGWGRIDESWRAIEELRAYGAEPTWFGLGDRDLGTHLVRSGLLAAGVPLSEVTARLCARWWAHDPGLRLLPMTDDPVETYVDIADPAAAGGRRSVHFQEYWVRLHAGPEALAIAQVGIEAARPAPGVEAALAAADLVLVGPSNPVVSIGPILAVPGLRDAVRASPAPVLGFSGILHGAPVLGMAHRLLPTIGVAVDAGAVGRHYGARTGTGVLDTWVVDTSDAASVTALEADGLPTLVRDLVMSHPDATASFVRSAVDEVLVSRGSR